MKWIHNLVVETKLVTPLPTIEENALYILTFDRKQSVAVLEFFPG